MSNSFALGCVGWVRAHALTVYFCVCCEGGGVGCDDVVLVRRVYVDVVLGGGVWVGFVVGVGKEGVARQWSGGGWGGFRVQYREMSIHGEP